MGGRSGVKTAVDLFVAFQHQRVWKQADLARSLQVGSKTVRRELLDMCEAGVPLIFQNNAYWKETHNAQ